jgi:hypothetical protein
MKKVFCCPHTKAELFTYGYLGNVLCIGDYPEYDLTNSVRIYIADKAAMKLFAIDHDVILRDDITVGYCNIDGLIRIRNTQDDIECENITNQIGKIMCDDITHKRIKNMCNDFINDARAYYHGPMIKTNAVYLISSILLLARDISVKYGTKTFNITKGVVYHKGMLYKRNTAVCKCSEFIRILFSDRYETYPKTRDVRAFHTHLMLDVYRDIKIFLLFVI